MAETQGFKERVLDPNAPSFMPRRNYLSLLHLPLCYSHLGLKVAVSVPRWWVPEFCNTSQPLIVGPKPTAKIDGSDSSVVFVDEKSFGRRCGGVGGGTSVRKVGPTRKIRGLVGEESVTHKQVWRPKRWYPFGDSTTLMIRNIPNRLRRSELLELLEDHCREQNMGGEMCVSEFDFLYLPVDFKKKGNKGYAFVNFTSSEGAARLYTSWNSTQWGKFSYNSKKICEISPALIQGKEELKRHFERSVFVCETDEYLPVELLPARNGVNSHELEMVLTGTRALASVDA